MIIEWGNLSGFWLLLPVVVGCVLIFLTYKFKRKVVALLVNESANGLSKNVFGVYKFKLVLWWMGLLFLFIAFLGPRWGDSDSIVPQKGRDVIVAIDVSKSMLAEDLKPSRLLFAKGKIKKLIESLDGDRIGLILFSGDAFVMCPLTRDKEILLTFLDDVSVETISSGTTDTAKAIEVATKMVQESGGNATKLLTIFTDGEDFSESVEAAGKQAKEVGLHIFAVGVATGQGAPIPDIDNMGNKNGFVKNKQGSIVISKLNKELLKDLSNKCDGGYVEAVVSDDSDVQKVTDFITSFERKQIDDKKLNNKEERYYFFAAVSLVCFLIEWVL